MPKRLLFAIFAAMLIMCLEGSCCPVKDAAYDFPQAGSRFHQADSKANIPAIPASVPGSYDLTAGWKVYTNTQDGYEMRYPGTWYVREDNPNTPGVSIRHILQHTDFSPARDYDQYKSQAFFCSVIVWENQLKLPIKDWLKRENLKHPALLSGQTITIGDKTIIRHEPQGNAYYINDWMANNDRTYQVFYCEPSREHAYTAIFNLMLETLRFTRFTRVTQTTRSTRSIRSTGFASGGVAMQNPYGVWTPIWIRDIDHAM